MKISQREARRLRKRVIELEQQFWRMRNRWATDFGPGWVNIETLTLSDASYAKLSTARKLDHAVVVVMGDNNRALFYADRFGA